MCSSLMMDVSRLWVVQVFECARNYRTVCATKSTVLNASVQIQKRTGAGSRTGACS